MEGKTEETLEVESACSKDEFNTMESDYDIKNDNFSLNSETISKAVKEYKEYYNKTIKKTAYT